MKIPKTMSEVSQGVKKVVKNIVRNTISPPKKPVINLDQNRINRENVYAQRVRRVNPRLKSLQDKRLKSNLRRISRG